MQLIIDGQPIPKSRARTVTLRIGKSRTYDPQDAEKTAMQWKIKNQADCRPLQGALIIQLDFYMKPCDSTSKTELNAKLHGLIEHTQKPDLDNLEKFILDCANGILYNDDSQIISIKSSKQWSENPRTEIKIMRKEDMDIKECDKQIINLFSPSQLEELYNDAKILFILQENSKCYHEHDKQKWLKQSSSSLSLFAQKYADKLVKINKMKKKQILKEVIEETLDGKIG